MPNSSKYYFSIAKEVAKSGRQTKSCKRVGAVVVKNSLILATGRNRSTGKIHLGNIKKDGFISLHAEIDACSRISKSQLKGTTIYVYRELADGKTASAKPCLSCQSKLKKFGIKRAIFTNENGEVEELII